MTNFIDARAFQGATDLEADVCIAGAGAAGITLARTLADKGHRVIVIESGGLERDAATQALYEGINSGANYFELETTRERYFGGSTNRWGGFCGYMSELSYEGRPEIGLPAWGIARRDLSPYFRHAAETLGIDNASFETANLVSGRGDCPSTLFDQASNQFETLGFVYAPKLRLGQLHRDALATHPNVQIFLNLNVTYVQQARDGARTDHLKARTLCGRSYKVRAKCFVLACHAIENARLMLLSDNVAAAGIGNVSGQVGRNFMEHMHIGRGRFTANLERFPRYYFSETRSLRLGHMFALNLSDHALRENAMASYYASFVPVYANEHVFQSGQDLRWSIARPFLMRAVRDFATVMGNLPDVPRILKDRRGQLGTVPLYFDVHHRIEQAPNSNSRISLTRKKDALGLPVVDLHWAFNDLDLHTINRGHQIVLRELKAMSMGRFSPVQPFTMADLKADASGHWHHMGTTRMSPSARTGAVDSNCLVHGTNNLYVAGSSVFPTGGRCGPTFTVIAMAFRLSDHLDKVLTSPVRARHTLELLSA